MFSEFLDFLVALFLILVCRYKMWETSTPWFGWLSDREQMFLFVFQDWSYLLFLAFDNYSFKLQTFILCSTIGGSFVFNSAFFLNISLDIVRSSGLLLFRTRAIVIVFHLVQYDQSDIHHKKRNRILFHLSQYDQSCIRFRNDYFVHKEK